VFAVYCFKSSDIPPTAPHTPLLPLPTSTVAPFFLLYFIRVYFPNRSRRISLERTRGSRSRGSGLCPLARAGAPPCRSRGGPRVSARGAAGPHGTYVVPAYSNLHTLSLTVMRGPITVFTHLTRAESSVVKTEKSASARAKAQGMPRLSDRAVPVRHASRGIPFARARAAGSRLRGWVGAAARLGSARWPVLRARCVRAARGAGDRTALNRSRF
jgi:hypothetical protein